MSDVDVHEAPQALREFQLAFGRHLRAPDDFERPKGVPERPTEIYTELLFSNVCGFIDRCFPVAMSLFSDSQWLKLCRSFYRDWRCTTPLFSDIPLEFVSYIASELSDSSLPEWLSELLHYEWAELEVDKADDPIRYPVGDSTYGIYANSTLRNLAYEWPVQCISSDFRPSKKIASYLAVYRRLDYSVEFLEINAMTAVLLQEFVGEPQSPEPVLRKMAKQMNYPDHDKFVEFGLQLIDDLVGKEILFNTGVTE